MRRKLRTVRSLSRQDRGLVLRAWILLLLVDLGLRLLPFQRFVKLLRLEHGGADRRSPGDSLSPALRLPDAEPVAVFPYVQWLLEVACRNYPHPATCLRRTIVLQMLLKHFGISGELHMGVRKEGNRLEAHAWLEHNGCPVGQSKAVSDRFKPIARITLPQS